MFFVQLSKITADTLTPAVVAARVGSLPWRACVCVSPSPEPDPFLPDKLVVTMPYRIAQLVL